MPKAASAFTHRWKSIKNVLPQTDQTFIKTLCAPLFRCTSYFWGLECFRRWLVLWVGGLAELQHAGVYVEPTELGRDGGRHELVILQRPASRFDQLGGKFQTDWSSSKCHIWGQSEGKQDKKSRQFSEQGIDYLKRQKWLKTVDISIVILALCLEWSVWIASNLWLDTDSQPQSCQWTNPRHRSRIRCRSSPECGPPSSWVCRPARETTHNIVVPFVRYGV